MVTACSLLVGETPAVTGDPDPSTTAGDPTATTDSPPARNCVKPTGEGDSLNSGEVSSDALHLSGELFVCADEVVVVGEGNLAQTAVAAQLAAVLKGPLLFPHPQLAAELGRLDPTKIHLVGAVEVIPPPGTEVVRHDLDSAVSLVREMLAAIVVLGVAPDNTTDLIVQTVEAIVEGSQAVTASPSPGPEPDTGGIVNGLAPLANKPTVWLVDARNPTSVLLAAAMGATADASVVAVDGDDLLAYPEVGRILDGLPPEAIRRVGGLNEVDPWEWEVLLRGVEIPGGGFRIFPRESKRRYLAFYGHPETSALGVLGEQGPEDTLRRMQPFLSDYAADGAQVVPVFEIMASVASASATDDGDYSYEWPISTFDEWVDVAEANGVYVVLDLQPGRDDFLTQAKQYEELLLRPDVGLALDPEWRLGPNQVHLKQIGRVDAEEVNQVIDWLADLVRDNGLPQKLLLVHQFRFTMIQNRENLKARPELQLVIQMDGDGSWPQKDETYALLTAGTEEAPWMWGWKNFFDEDEPGPPPPEHVLGQDPVPVFVSFQ
ncbi:MAG: hypothetical protein ACE5F5_09965 [Acidimicrobiia bacterium]